MPQLRKKDQDKIESVMVREMNKKPPCIGICGVSGTGKSSTLNALFRTSFPTNATVACTSEFVQAEVNLMVQSGHAKGAASDLIVFDAPGLGEDTGKDPEFLEMYREYLPKVDVILYVFAARNRAIALDQQYLRQLVEFAPKMVFGLSQVDLVAPINWEKRLNLPSEEQLDNIKAIAVDRANRISRTLGRQIELVPYSSKYGFGLQKLFTKLITTCPQERSWIFQGLKNFDPVNFFPQDALKILSKQEHP